MAISEANNLPIEQIDDELSTEPVAIQRKYESQLVAFEGLGFPDEQGWITELLDRNDGDFGKTFNMVCDIFKKASR
jgi:hypothetical protein